MAICVEAVNSTARDECDIVKRQAIRTRTMERDGSGGGGGAERHE